MLKLTTASRRLTMGISGWQFKQLPSQTATLYILLSLVFYKSYLNAYVIYFFEIDRNL